MNKFVSIELKPDDKDSLFQEAEEFLKAIRKKYPTVHITHVDIDTNGEINVEDIVIKGEEPKVINY